MPWQREATSFQFRQLNWPVVNRVALHTLLRFNRLNRSKVYCFALGKSPRFSQLNCASTTPAHQTPIFPFTRLDLSLAAQACLFGKIESNQVNVKNSRVKHHIQFSQLNIISNTLACNIASIQFSQLNCALTDHDHQAMLCQFSQLNIVSNTLACNIASIQFSQLNCTLTNGEHQAVLSQFSQLNYRFVRRKPTDGRPPHLDPRPPRTTRQQHKASVKRLRPFSFQAIYNKTSISRLHRQMDVRFYKGRP